MVNKSQCPFQALYRRRKESDRTRYFEVLDSLAFDVVGRAVLEKGSAIATDVQPVYLFGTPFDGILLQTFIPLNGAADEESGGAPEGREGALILAANFGTETQGCRKLLEANQHDSNASLLIERMLQIHCY